LAKCDRTKQMIWLVFIAVANGSACSIQVNGTSAAETFDEFCDQWSCENGDQYAARDCLEITLTKTDQYQDPNDNYFYEFGSYIHFAAEIPRFDKEFKGNLTRISMWFGGYSPVKLYDVAARENPFVEWYGSVEGSNAIVRASIEMNETYLSPQIDGGQHDMDVTFLVYNNERADIVQRRIFPIVVVAKKCIHQTDKLAAPDTYAQFPCPCEGPDCDNATPINGSNITTTTTTQASERVILRYCSIYGWDDENSKDYCEDEPDLITYESTTRVTTSNDGLIVMIGVILIGLLLLMCVGLCLFQKLEVEEDRLRAKLAEMSDSTSEDDSLSNSDEEGEEGETSSFQEHVAREGEQIATKLEILNTRRHSVNRKNRSTDTFKGVITENNKITAAATKVRYQLEQLIATNAQDDGSRKRRVGEEEKRNASKRVPLAVAPASKADEPAPVLVQFPVSIEAHQGNLDLLTSTSDTAKSAPTETSGESSSNLKKGKGPKGRIAAELATLALLKETGNLTNEEFLYSKNLILYE